MIVNQAGKVKSPSYVVYPESCFNFLGTSLIFADAFFVALLNSDRVRDRYVISSKNEWNARFFIFNAILM